MTTVNEPGLVVHRWYETYEGAERGCDYYAGDFGAPARIIEDTILDSGFRYAVEVGMQELPDNYIEQYRNEGQGHP